MDKINIGIANLFVAKKIKDSYFNNSLLEESKKISSNFFDVVKNSPLLQLEYKVFNNIEDKHIDNESLAIKYIDNNIKLFEVYTLQELESEHNKLIPFIKSYSKNIDENKYDLYCNIETLIKESLSDYEYVDVDKIHEAFTYILNHVKEPKVKTDFTENNELITENVVEIAINKFNKKYENINDEDKSILKKLLKSNLAEKQELFESIRKENIQLFEKVDPAGAESKILKTIEKLNNMKFNKKTADDDIINLHELKKGFL